MRKNLLRLGLATAAAIGLSLGTGTAFATPGGPGVKGTIISQTTIGGKDYILRQITLPPGRAQAGTSMTEPSTALSSGARSATSTPTAPLTACTGPGAP